MMMYRNLLGLCVAASMGVGTSVTAFAHHAFSIHYDVSDIAEFEGQVTSVRWANPHSIITVQGREANAPKTEWRIEAAAAATILRAGMRREDIEVGDTIRAAGFRGRNNTNAIFLRNLLLDDGREMLAGRSTPVMWTDNIVGAEHLGDVSEPVNDRAGIFRVWSLDEATVPKVGPPRPLWNDSYPLTAMAAEAKLAWAQSTENPYVNCQNGMPAIMDTPIPMEFVREGENIVLRFEELDVRRVIYMGDAGQTQPVVSSPYGHSTGRWDGETLVVHVAAIDWKWFDQEGVPLTQEAEITERFTVSSDGAYLNYVATVVDVAVFTEPVVLDRRWAYIASEEIQDYDCRWDETSL